jgi:hypothetical protein
MPCRTKKSSTCLHLLMHIFMVHGVDPLVEEAVNMQQTCWMGMLNLVLLTSCAFSNIAHNIFFEALPCKSLSNLPVSFEEPLVPC